MPTLTEAQARLRDCCLKQLTRPSWNGGIALLLTGKPGGGKRFLARAIAESLNCEFQEIPLRGPEAALRCRLFGTEGRMS